MSGAVGKRAPWPRPDPALGPPRPGLRPHRHPPNHLHGWVFLQHQVWVDYYGNEHEIESMPADYIAAVIAFCELRAMRISALVICELILASLERAFLAEDEGKADCADRRLEPDPWAAVGSRDDLAQLTPLEFLNRLPLMVALRRRLARVTRGT